MVLRSVAARAEEITIFLATGGSITDDGGAATAVMPEGQRLRPERYSMAAALATEMAGVLVAQKMSRMPSIVGLALQGLAPVETKVKGVSTTVQTTKGCPAPGQAIMARLRCGTNTRYKQYATRGNRKLESPIPL